MFYWIRLLIKFLRLYAMCGLAKNPILKNDFIVAAFCAHRYAQLFYKGVDFVSRVSDSDSESIFLFPLFSKEGVSGDWVY